MPAEYELGDLRAIKNKANDNDNKLEIQIRTNDDGRPIDRYKMVFIVLLIHGIGTLMPWNMFINAQEYFREYKLAGLATNSSATDLDEHKLDNYRKNFLSYLGVASQIPNVLFNGLNLLFNMGGSGNLKLRVNLALVVEALIFALTISLAVVDSSRWKIEFFYLTMVSVVVLNMASGIYQSCIFGTGAKFPGNYTNAILIGSNFSGTFTSTVNLLAIWLAPAPREAAIYYFVTALLIIFACLLSYNLLPLNPFYRHFDLASQQQQHQRAIKLGDEPRGLLAANNEQVPENMRRTVEEMVPKNDQEEVDVGDSSFLGELNKKWRVFLKCWPQCLNVFLTFYFTLALFPAVMADIRPQPGSIISLKYFTSFACFFIFNVFAMIGNLISSWTTWPGKQHVWIIVVARVLFIPFFLFCNFNPATRKWPVLINSDIAYTLGNVLLALSSGYLSSLSMMFASSDLKPEEAPKAGMLAAFFLLFGIFLGINSSFFLTWIVERG